MIVFRVLASHVFLVDLSAIDFSISLNTNVIGGIITYIPLRLPSDLLFNDFFSQIVPVWI